MDAGGKGARSEIFAEGLLSGRVALVTGGGTGLGRATALELARCGADVTIVGRRQDVLEAAAEEMSAIGTARWVSGDVREPEEAMRLVGETLGAHGRLDVLVNNAGG